ncbi:hypothetical protein MF672_031540 [Actinomadura sp. ATCC 31491]|uniref:Uncharacterized protein n=1 Tax=Actinomadura luzonensis TaxID=2805427 RepID=A0ABT0G117_9ACTN|nr:hypothetical protein [Actinomadura luzonensis]MCK2218291.1 hypothetical protein [Actinomadura luzonensis]
MVDGHAQEPWVRKPAPDEVPKGQQRGRLPGQPHVPGPQEQEESSRDEGCGKSVAVAAIAFVVILVLAVIVWWNVR